MTRNPTYAEFPAPWNFIQRKLNETKVADVYFEVAGSDSHGAALYAATVEGRNLGISDAEVKRIIG